MKHFVLTTIIYLLLQIKYINTEKSFLQFRKTILKRAYIAIDKTEKICDYSYKIITTTKNNVENIHEYAINKYHNINVFYNNLTENEKEFMKAIMLLVL